MQNNYENFLRSKSIIAAPQGFRAGVLNERLFDFQKAIVKWSCERGKSAVFAGCGLGKGQPIGSKVLTPNGWQEIQTLQIGDDVIASNGKSCKVTGVFPKSGINTYRVHFGDESSFVVDEEHLHIVRTCHDKHRGKDWRVLSTKDLLESKIRYGKNGKSRTFEIPLVKPVEFASKKTLPIDPYVLGVLIGDGSIKTAVNFSNPDKEIVQKVSANLGNEFNVNQKSEIDYSITYPTSRSNPIATALRELKLFGCGSSEKYIPNCYLFAPIESRVELLRGLMDTDGYIESTSQYYTTSAELAENVVFLIRSLGGAPTRAIKKNPKFTYKGEYRTGKDCHVITFSLKTFNPFSLTRKAEKWNPSPRDNGRWIDRIEFESIQKTVCISVDSADSSYVTENFTVTHNTIIQLEWARKIADVTRGAVLILAPLAVSKQTVAEAEKFGIKANLCKDLKDVEIGINITNYEKLDKFDASMFDGIVLDESSILKGLSSKTRAAIFEAFKQTPYKLACTATPAPNDFTELCNHVEFLGVMSRAECLATFFTHDGGDTGKWRLKKHAEADFYKFLSSFCVMFDSPADLGFKQTGYDLPPISYSHTVLHAKPLNGQLFAMGANTLTERREVRKDSLQERVAACVANVRNAPDESHLIFCDFNDEGGALEKALKDLNAVQVAGANSDEFKESTANDFATGKIKILISKSRIFGFGMNFQICSNVHFVGVSDSYESIYQAIRRVYRFGQKSPVKVYFYYSENEQTSVANIERKERDAERLRANLVKQFSTFNKIKVKSKTMKITDDYKTGVYKTANAELRLGDSCELMKTLADESIHYSIFSPPFASLYTYSNSPRDLGNAKTRSQFFEHFDFIVSELYRTLKSGRLVSIHCMNLPKSKQFDGVIGLSDFRGDIIRLFEQHGFTFHSEVCVWKDPVIAMQRTKAIGLLHKQVVKDSSLSRQGVPDYLVTMRKADKPNAEPITGEFDEYVGEDALPDGGRFSIGVWQRYASPVWFDINPSLTLQRESAREQDDERHICPLQLQVIERALQLWTNPGDTVFTPFLGIGSEAFVAVKKQRRAIGFELKSSYFAQAVRNIERAEVERINTNQSLFENLPEMPEQIAA